MYVCKKHFTCWFFYFTELQCSLKKKSVNGLVFHHWVNQCHRQVSSSSYHPHSQNLCCLPAYHTSLINYECLSFSTAVNVVEEWKSHVHSLHWTTWDVHVMYIRCLRLTKHFFDLDPGPFETDVCVYKKLHVLNGT